MFEKILTFIRFLKYNTLPERMEMKSRKIVLFGSNQALGLFKNEKFREYLKFSEISQDEQNRIFNELTVTNLILLMLMINQKVQEEDDEEKREYYKALRQAVPDYFKNFLREIKTPEKYAKIWDKLIDLRYDEYINEVLNIRREFFKNSGELAELALDNNVMIFQAIVLGLYRHLVRGKIKKGDPLYKYLQPNMLYVYKEYLKKI